MNIVNEKGHAPVIGTIKEELRILELFVRSKGCRMTNERVTILETFLSLEEHVTAEKLYEETRKRNPKIGQATVFRNLKLFVEAGLARETVNANLSKTYEHSFNHTDHGHIVCVSCGKIIEFESKEIESMRSAIFKRYGFEKKGSRFELYGVCPDCAASKTTGSPENPPFEKKPRAPR